MDKIAKNKLEKMQDSLSLPLLIARRETQTLLRTASAGCLRRSWRRARLWSVSTAGVEVAQARRPQRPVEAGEMRGC